MHQDSERLAECGHQVTVATTCLPERQARRLNGVGIKEFRLSGNLAREHSLSQFTIVPNGASEREFLVPKTRGSGGGTASRMMRSWCSP